MLVKAGVDISRLKRAIRRSLCIVEKVLKKYGYELVITSTYDGNHLPCSLHYANDAYDFRWNRKRNPTAISEIKEALGPGYDVINEGNHIHIEFDPTKRENRK